MEHTEKEYSLFFGKEETYYIKVLRELESGKKIVFNIYAFLFGVFWLLYRKQYYLALALILISISQGMIEEFLYTMLGFSPNAIFSLITSLIWPSLIGMFANMLYIRLADRKIASIKEEFLPEEELHARIQKAGGTSWWLPLLIPVVIIIFLILVDSISSPLFPF